MAKATARKRKERPGLPFKLRKGTTADASPLYPLYRTLRPKDKVSESDFARLLGAVLMEQTELWIAETDEQPIGFLTLRIGTTLHGRRSGTIEELVVDPKVRRGGIGTALIHKAIERARAAGCWSLELATYPGGLDVPQFYEKFGFKSSSTFYRLSI